MCNEVMSAILSLFEEMTDNCLLYLASCPVTLTSDDLLGASQLTNGLQLHFPMPHTCSTQFFILTIILCAQYAQTNISKLLCSVIFCVGMPGLVFIRSWFLLQIDSNPYCDTRSSIAIRLTSLPFSNREDYDEGYF